MLLKNSIGLIFGSLLMCLPTLLAHASVIFQDDYTDTVWTLPTDTDTGQYTVNEIIMEPKNNEAIGSSDTMSGFAIWTPNSADKWMKLLDTTGNIAAVFRCSAQPITTPENLGYQCPGSFAAASMPFSSVSTTTDNNFLIFNTSWALIPSYYYSIDIRYLLGTSHGRGLTLMGTNQGNCWIANDMNIGNKNCYGGILKAPWVQWFSGDFSPPSTCTSNCNPAPNNEYFLDVPGYWGGLHIFGDESFYSRSGNSIDVTNGPHQILKDCVDTGPGHYSIPELHTLSCQNVSYFPGAGYTQDLNDFSNLADGTYMFLFPNSIGQPTFNYAWFAVTNHVVNILGHATTTSTCTQNCNSNVMFLPGIEASRLYVPGLIGDDQIWPPNSVDSSDVTELNLTNPSTADTVYTKQGNVLDTAYDVFDVYKDFISQVNDIVTNGTIAAWEPIAYDWRLDYQDLLTHGNQTSDGKIYYRGSNSATTTPYIVQELKHLAATSRTGKVTIIAHSNGGLLAKALLMQPDLARYVDKVVMVAVPQLGTPKAVGGLLHGYASGLPSLAHLFFNEADARYLGENTPMIYNLLPSNQYFSSISNPVITFDFKTFPEWVQRYGASVTTSSGLNFFMTDTSRISPSYHDTVTPSIANPSFFNNATLVHTSLDTWAPPVGVQFVTIAGWGDETLSGIKYIKDLQFTCLVYASDGSCAAKGFTPVQTYDPLLVIDGDGTVVDGSAQWNKDGTAQQYWINLAAYNASTSQPFPSGHANIFEVSKLRILLSNIVTGSTSTLPQYISTTRPTYDGSTPRLHFVLHSPLTLGFTDSSGNYTGSTATSSIFTVPGVDYERFGEVQWLSVPQNMAGQVVMHGIGSGSFSLDVESVNGNQVLATTSFAGVPSATSTIATLVVNPSTSPTQNGVLAVDFNGDGTTDRTLQAKQGSVVLPDITAPEALITVSTSTKDILVTGIDDASTTIAKTATTTVITDLSGNKTTLFFQKMFSNNLLTYARLTGINYGTSTLALPSSFLYVWDAQKTLISQTVVADNTFAIQALYNKLQNKTTIIVLKKNTPIQTTTLLGLKVIRLTTNKGTVSYSW